MKKSELPLPAEGSSVAMAVFRLEQISQAIYASIRQKRKGANSNRGTGMSFDPYGHFRGRAYELLTHYVANDLQASFSWLLAMRNSAPKRRRGRVAGNPFHIGLLSMTAAAGTFMSRNKLRDLAALMHEAYVAGVHENDFNNFVSKVRKVTLRRSGAKLSDKDPPRPEPFDTFWD